MTTDTQTPTVRDILETALGTSLDGIENPGRQEIESWDSLTHVEIVFMLEEQFDVRFGEEEIATLRSLDDIVEILRAKHAT
jgi:acyl carrier protein